MKMETQQGRYQLAFVDLVRVRGGESAEGFHLRFDSKGREHVVSNKPRFLVDHEIDKAGLGPVELAQCPQTGLDGKAIGLFALDGKVYQYFYTLALPAGPRYSTEDEAVNTWERDFKDMMVGYEVIEKYESEGKNNPLGLKDGAPMRVRIYPEDKKAVLTAMVMAAYSMEGVPGLDGLAAIGSPEALCVEDALKYLVYGGEDNRAFWDRVHGVLDKRVPVAVRADNIHGRAVKLNMEASEEVRGTYEMFTPVFMRDVGPVETLFERTEKLIPMVQEELLKIKPFYKRVFA